MSKLHDDLINEIEPSATVPESIDSAFRAIADRIEGCRGDRVKLSDLCSILREDTTAVANAVVANTPAANSGQPTRSTSYDAPSPAFDRPREDVRPGMPDPNDHRDQVTPPNANTEVEKAQIRTEQKSVAEGKQPVILEQPVSPAPPSPAASVKDDKPAKTPA
jgi:hypothetical protein